MAARDDILGHLQFLYGADRAGALYSRLEGIIARRQEAIAARHLPNVARFSEQDVMLITYGDMVQSSREAPLQTLHAFLEKTVSGHISAVHILPFYPYSSDDGFSVIDYWQVNPELGNWSHIEELAGSFRLMFDGVINHISAESDWFKGFLAGDERYRDYFVVVEPGVDLSEVFRPRALPLLTAVQQRTATGEQVERLVWTTFSADQIDLNFVNPDVLLEIVDLLLFYCAMGCQYIRLDAIAYMWKEAGTSSIHLPQTHRIIQLLRRVLDLAAPQVALITETNVPHKDNISYFGDGHNEAQMVYNFTLPPLTLHAFHTGDASALSRWASTLSLPSDDVTLFNFLASHDGIGVTPLVGILDDKALAALAQRIRALGGFVSERARADGSTTPYELNINYLDALGDPEAAAEAEELVARRFLTSQAIMLAMRGVPGIYFHSLFGSRSWAEGVAQTGRVRTINRQKLDKDQLERELSTPGSLRHLVFNGYRQMLAVRRKHPAFHPTAPQEVLFGNEALFVLRRQSPDGARTALCLHNVSGKRQSVTLGPADLGLDEFTRADNLLDGPEPRVEQGRLEVEINAYDRVWLDLR